jgi:pimeloyl-ACP methyl ester carboxylesterase
MTRYYIRVCLGLFLWILFGVSENAQAAPTLNISPSSVQQTAGTFTYTGSNYTPNGTVRRFIIPPGGSQQEISSTTANSSGQVFWTFSPTCADPVGTTIVWTRDSTTNQQSNSVNQTVTSHPSCLPAPTLNSNPSSVQQANGTFTVTGSNYTPNGTVRRFIIPPGGSQQEISSTTANGSGNVNWAFSPTCSDPVGTTTLWAVDAATNRQSNNVSQTVTSNTSCSPPTLSSNPSSVQQANGNFTVTGSNYTPNGTVRRFIIPPGGSQQEISSITANGSGQVNWTFSPACTDPVGTTTLWAVDAATNRQSNNVTQTVTANPACSPAPTLNSNPASVQQANGTFTVTGSNYTPNGTVRRFIVPPGGSQQEISSTTANASGQVNWTFSPTCSDPVGTTTLWVVDASTNRQSNNITQTVTANSICSAPTLSSTPASVQQANGTFTITGSNYTPNGTVRRFIIPPGGAQQEISSITASNSGQVNWTFSPTCNDPVGTTTLWAIDAATNRQSNNVTQTVTANPTCASVTLSSSPSSVQQASGIFTVTGSNYTPNGTVRRFIIPPGGSQQEISSTTANSSGNVNWTFAPACTDPVGTTTLWAIDAATNRQSNNVTQTVTANPACSPAPTLSSTPASAQQANGSFTVTGSNYTPNGTVRRFIIPPGGSQQEISSTTANASGNVNWTFAPACTDPVGTTTLWAVDAVTNRQSNNVTQTVTANSICSPPTLNSSPASVQQANGSFTVTGSNYTPNGTVRRFIIPPGGSQQEISSTTANASGQVNWTFAPSCTDTVGTTTLWAVDGATNRQSNNVTQTVTANSTCSATPTLISTPASVQQANGTFTVTGSNYTPNGTVRRFIIPPGGSQQEISSTTANASGNVNWTFAPACSDPVGATTLWAVDAATNRQSNTVAQTVTANSTCTPAPTLSSSPAAVQQANGSFTVTGSNYTPNGTVRRFTIPPGGSQQEISSTTASASGQVNWTFSPACTDPVGTTTLWAVDGATNRRSNNVTQTVTANQTCGAVTLTVSPTSGSKNGTVFTYDGDNYTPNGTINRFLQFPDGHTEQIASITANSSGHGHATFTASCTDLAGTYTLHWVDAATNRSSGNVQVTENDSPQCTTPVDAATFIQGSIADGAQMSQGQRFTASWTVRNSGTTTWNSNYKLRWAGGQNLSNHADVTVNGSVPPGGSYTFSIPMTAPGTPGLYREDWQLVNPTGTVVNVGSNPTVWVSIRVGSNCQPPVITDQPNSANFSSGTAAMLFAFANQGQPPLTYQWYQGQKGDTSHPIAGANSSLYTTPRLFATTSFWVRIISACGASVDSNTATITVGMTIEAVDPVCDSYTNCQGAYLTITPRGPGAVGVVSDVSALTMANATRHGIVADGISLLLLRVHTDSSVTFSLNPGVGTLMKRDGSQEGTSVTVEPEDTHTSQGKIAFALYKAPLNFSGINNPTPITVRAQIASGPLVTRTLNIYRPPVVLVHGLWGRGSTWGTVVTRLRDHHYEVCDGCIVDYYYDQNASGSFDPSQPGVPIREVANASGAAVKQYRQSGIAISQVDVIAHSMGGLVVRARTAQMSDFKRKDNYYAGDFHKIITIGTPHSGTPLADWLGQHENRVTATGLTVKQFFETLHRPFGQGVYQLEESSFAIRNIERGETAVPTFAIVGVAPQDSCSKTNLNAFLKLAFTVDTTDGLLRGVGNHDNLVPVQSQTGGFTSDSVPGVVHSQLEWPAGAFKTCRDLDELHSPDVINKALNFLSAPIAPGSLSANALASRMESGPVAGLDINPAINPTEVLRATSTVVTASAVSISPSPGAVVHPGDIVNIAFSLSGGNALDGAVVIIGDRFTVLEGPGAFSIPYSVPPEQAGRIDVTVLTYGPGPENYKATTYIIVAPNQPLSAVNVSPRTVSISQPGQRYQLLVTGQLADGTQVDLTPGTAGTSYALASGINRVVSVSPDGLLEGRAIGEETILVAYSGVTYTVNVTVGDSAKPRITGASVSGKKLVVTGENFDDGATILMDGERQKTANDDLNPRISLIGKKAGKKISSGQTVTLMVKNSDGTLSNAFSFTRP